MSQPGADLRASVLAFAQPPVEPQRLSAARGHLVRYRVMAFVTGVVLLVGTVALIVKYSTSADIDDATRILWVGHGYLYLVYVITTAVLGLRLRWPIGRYLLVMLAGTIPTMSFVAEQIVTRAARAAATSTADPAAGDAVTAPPSGDAAR